MDKYEKCAASLMELGDNIIAEKKRKATIIRKISFSISGLCAAIIVGVGIWHNQKLRTPNDFKFPDTGIIAETETTATTSSSKNTVTTATSASSTTAAATGSKTTEQTSVSSQQRNETTKASTQPQNQTETATQNIRNSISSSTTDVTSKKTETTALATVTSDIQTSKTVKTTAAPVVDPNSSSATSMTVSIESNRMDQFSITCMEKRYSRTGMTVTENDLNEKFFDDIVIYDDSEIIRNVNLKLFGIKELSQDYMIAAQIDNEEIYHLFRGGYKPDTIQSVFRTMALKKYWHIDSYIHKNDTSQNGYIVDNINDTAKANIFDILLDIDNRELKRGGETGTKIMTLYLESEFLGATEVSFTENGYIVIRFDRNIYTAFIESGETEKIIKSIIMEA